MSALPDRSEVAAREADFDRAAGHPALSPAEQQHLDRAVAEEQSRQRRDSAIEVIAEACDEYEVGYDELAEQPRAGEIAAKLLATWTPSQQPEPMQECDYALAGMLSDVKAALAAHGLDTYDERCAEIGRRLVDSCRDYIFSVHGMTDGEDGERIASERVRERRRALARRYCEEA